jgi:hypothetical protein
VSIPLDQLRRARPDVLREVAGLLLLERVVLEQALGELVASRVATVRWTGPAAAAAAGERDALIREVQAVCRGIGASRVALLRAADELEQATALLCRADARAAEAGGRVDPGGRLVVPPRLTRAGDTVTATVAMREEERLRWEVEALVARAVDDAGVADRELARALTAAVSDTACYPAVSADLVLRPPVTAPGRPPEALAFASAAWWQALSEAEQDWVIAEHPDWVGPRDGLPASARHAANLLLLARAEREAATALAEVERRGRVADPLLGVGFQGEAAGRQERQRVADLEAIREVISQDDGEPRLLLQLGAAGPLVTAAVGVGDVDRAEHVATFVGGLSTTVRDLPRYDRTFTRMRAKARGLGGGAELAVVTWMGYPAPQPGEILTVGGRSVLSDRVARDNAAALASFANGLDAARARPAHQTLWAHSYGSVVGGFALRRTNGFDDVALFGSPGVAFTSLSEAGLKPGALNVLRADWDVVGYSGWHLTDPADVPGVSMLSTGWSKPDGTNPALPSTGHSEYLKAGSTSEHNLVAVAIGRPDLRVLDP